jgi:hypothetical protein
MQNGYKNRKENQNLLSNMLIPHEANKDIFLVAMRLMYHITKFYVKFESLCNLVQH